jgi:RNA recognition motif-containing protein
MNIHVSNLHINLIESDLQRLFSPYGEIASVSIVRDKLNNRSKGRAYIDMPVDKQAQKAILDLDGHDLKGKIITVTELRYDPNLSTYLFRDKEEKTKGQ